ncbi:MAG TPA: hypothetical protein VI643_07550 [Planctomycetota bacterium]|nr:hypothetical protein [Planctomycetota bacterium]
MERGALSDEAFPKFAEKYVVFMHITTRIEGEKHDKLLSEKGGTGFPFVVYMDADGNVVARHEGQRTIDGFETTAGKAREFLELKKKAEGGDKAAQLDLLKKQIEFRHFDSVEARKRVDAIADLDEATKKDLLEKIINMKIYEIIGTITADKATRIAAGKKYNEMRLAGELPKGDRELQYLWMFILEYAESASDVRLYETGVKAVEEAFGAKTQYKRWVDQIKQKLETLKANDREH